MVDRNTLKQWFSKGSKPLESQFVAWIDSFFHKSDEIPASNIGGLQNMLDNKADAQALSNIVDSLNDMSTTVERIQTSLEHVVVSLSEIPHQVALTQAEYDALPATGGNTYYNIYEG